MTLKLIVGNKNYSSWSLRPWIAMKAAGIPFEEQVISLDAPDFKAVVGAVSGTGKVPVLVDGDVSVWESLAILEYLAEKFPAAGLWPADAAARALARAVANEMHAGFQPLRKLMPMNHGAAGDQARADAGGRGQCAAHRGAVGRLPRALRRKGGPFLFGKFGAADAMYAPVVARFHTYAVEVSAPSRAYMDAVMALPAWREWHAAALKETWVLPEDEVDWPTVRRA